MKNEFLLALGQLAAEKNLPKEVVFEAVEAALTSAYRKEGENAPNIYAKIDHESGDIRAYMQKAVVESVVEPNVESENYRRTPSINLYAYADSNPLNLIDPMGLAPSLPGFVACVRACNEGRTGLARICTWCGPYSKICLAFSLARHALCIANCQAKFTNPPKK